MRIYYRVISLGQDNIKWKVFVFHVELMSVSLSKVDLL